MGRSKGGNRLSHRGPGGGSEERPLQPGDLRRMRGLRAQVEANRTAVAAARIHPRLWRGKKVPPMALLPPRMEDGKKIRNRWQTAAHIASVNADNEGDE